MSGRRQKNRELRHGTTLIVAEGDTEFYYFKNLREIYGYKCSVKPRFSGINSIKDFRKIITEYCREPISIVVLIDMDVISRDRQVKKDWDDLKNDCKKYKNVLFSESKPCLEYWFLLHYEDTCGGFHSSEVIGKLKKYIKNYQKTGKFLENRKWVKEMSVHSKGGLKEAKKRAKRHKDGLSYSKVYLAIEELEKTK